MCGIVGYIGSRDAAPIILEGLKRLEYRGYDSAGLALFDGDQLKVTKTKGKVAALEAKLKTEGNNSGCIGMGHTRWATHGIPNDENSHPWKLVVDYVCNIIYINTTSCNICSHEHLDLFCSKRLHYHITLILT